MNMHILEDKEYQVKHSQIDPPSRWGSWFWKLEDNKLYFRGMISGYSYTEWTDFDNCNIPLDLQDLRKLHKFLTDNET